MLTNKDIRVENGNIVLNGDKYPLDGQSPEAIMQIVKDNSDTTPTKNSNKPVKSGGIYSRIGDNSGTLTERVVLSASGNDSYTVTADSAIMVAQFEGYLSAASDVFEANVQVNGLMIGILAVREGVACNPTKREQIRIPFRVFKNDVIKITLSLTGSALGYAGLYTT